MAIRLERTETSDGFTIRVERPRSWLETLLNAAACGIFAYFFLPTLHLTRSVDIPASIMAGILAGYFKGKPRSITTTITKFEAHISGTFSGGYRPLPFVSLAEVSYLEYRAAVSGGGESADEPEGLWAVVQPWAVCLVPYIGPADSESLASAIHNRFEHILGSAPSRNTGRSATGLNQLNLNEP